MSQASNFVADESQVKLITILQQYKDKLEAKPKGRLARLFYREGNSNKHDGMYIWGEVGRGKSIIINLFFDLLQNENKLRIHFHEFMINIHKKLNTMRKQDEQGKSKKGDFIKLLADQIAEKYKVICLDELQVNNVTDAMVVARLFKALAQREVLVFFSSNFHPDDLFKDGLQRERFIPFIEHIKSDFEVYNLNNHHDYRLNKLNTIKSAYLMPLTEKTEWELRKIILDLTGHEHLSEKDIVVDHHRVLKCLNTHGNTAVFTFNELCGIPLGAIDYIALCKHFSTIIVKNIPQLHEENYNEALRFITLIDCLYDAGTRLICSAEVCPDELYSGSKFAFEFRRTISRLKEMQSAEYFRDLKIFQ